MTNAVALRAPSAGMFRRLMRNPLGASSVGFLLLIVCVATLVPLFPLSDPNSGQLTSSLLPPSSEHLLGTDSTGRDILSRLLWGTRTNLLGAALTVSVAFLIGVPTGIVAGYYGGWLDSLGSWFSNLFMALPGVVVLLAVRAVFGPSLWLSMGVFGVMLAPAYFRLVRSAVQTVRGELFIDAAIVSGVSDLRILGRHVVAVIRGALIIQAARLSVIAITIQAGLEFIGINDPTVPVLGWDAQRRISANERGGAAGGVAQHRHRPDECRPGHPGERRTRRPCRARPIRPQGATGRPGDAGDADARADRGRRGAVERSSGTGGQHGSRTWSDRCGAAARGARTARVLPG